MQEEEEEEGGELGTAALVQADPLEEDEEDYEVGGRAAPCVCVLVIPRYACLFAKQGK